MIKRFAVIGLLALSMVGCASVQMADPAQDAAAKKFEAKAGVSTLYIYRNEFIGTAKTMDLEVDGKLVGQTKGKTFVLLNVAPGKHTIVGKAENDDKLEIETLAGKVYYVWQEVKFGVLSARNKLSLVSAEVGQEGVKESKLALPPAQK